MLCLFLEMYLGHTFTTLWGGGSNCFAGTFLQWGGGAVAWVVGLLPGVVHEGSLPVLQSQYDALDMALQKDSKYHWCQC